MKKIDLIILAGGKGSRIKKYLKKKPKPLVRLGKRYFLDYLLNNICKYQLNKIYIIAGYRGRQIYNIYNNTEINLIPIKVIIEKKPLGTGGALYLIKKKITDQFLVINGDSLFDIDYNKIINLNLKKNYSFLALTKNSSYKSNNLLTKIKLQNSKIIKSKNSSLMNAGIYLLNKKIITNIKKEYKSLESDIIAKEIDKKKVVGRFFNGFFLDIGTPKNLIKAKKIIPKYFKRPAVFLDRDGTINHDRGGYTHSVKNFKFIKGTIKILKKITNMNYYIFIITNQAGIAKKKFTLEQFYKLHDYIKDKFLKNKIYIHDVKFCPYHPEAKVIKYKKKTAYRKPGNLMLEDLKTRWDINLKKSLMVGDKKTDLLAAKKSNIKFMYLNKNLENTLIKTFK